MNAQISSKKKISTSILKYLDRHINIVLVAPAVIILFGLVIYPFIYNINLSVQDASIFNIRSGDFKFVGLQNYITTVTSPFVQKAFLRTMGFAAVTVTLQLLLGMAAAMAFNVDFKGKGVLMPLALAPMMITPVAVGLFWRMLLNSPVWYYQLFIGFTRHCASSLVI